MSDKIRNLINSDIALYGANYGWQVMLHSSGNKLIVNVPTSEDAVELPVCDEHADRGVVQVYGMDSF